MRQGYILAALLTLFIITLLYNSSLQRGIEKKSSSLLAKESSTQQIANLKKKWSSNKKNKKMITNLLKKKGIKEKIKSKKEGKGTLKVALEDLDSKVLRDLTKKLFEKNIVIKSFKIVRKDKHKADLQFGVEF